MSHTAVERAERFGFLSAGADIARSRNPYLKLLIESRQSDRKLRESAQRLAAAWWRGWDHATASTPRGLQARRSALAAFGLHALDGSPSIE